MQASLARLLSGGFLYATRFGGDAGYAFKHALTHEVAYDSVSETARRGYTRRSFTAITKLAPETRERRPETLARHYTEAGRHAEAIEHWCRAGSSRCSARPTGRHRATRPGPSSSWPDSRRAPRGTPRKSRRSWPWRRRSPRHAEYGAPEVERTWPTSRSSPIG